ncbi:MAG: hypothetical protein WD826_10590, partial [Actinomycetota bacterium]
MILAHGVGGRADLPLSLTLVSYAASAILLVTFGALAWLWPRPRWQEPIAGATLPKGLDVGLRAIAIPVRIAIFAFFALAVVASFIVPPTFARSIAPFAVYVILWVGFLFASGLIGDLWAAIGPTSALARLRLRAERDYTFGHWPAAAGLIAFTWLELVYSIENNGARPLAVALTIYIVATLVGCLLWGRTWLREGDLFGATFRLLSYMAPFYRDDAGKLRVRPPLVGLPGMPVTRGTVALVMVALGSTTFDGFSRTRVWLSLAGDGGLIINSLGLIWTIGAVYALYRLAVSAMPMLAGIAKDERDPDAMAESFLHSLVPIAFAYAVAHYFSLLVFEGETTVGIASDPFGRGWNLFGTRGWAPTYQELSANAIAYVQ